MNDNKIIDLSYLLQASSDKEFLLKMFNIYKTLLPEIRLLLINSVAEKDYARLSESAHKLKSPISILGMSVTKKKVESLELDSKNAVNTETFEERVKIILDECNLALEEIIKFENGI